MSFPIYDYRSDIRNVLVTPQIRARFVRMEPGGGASLHSHDLGHEVFLVLEGEAAFTISGETRVLGPGQMCIARRDEPHEVRVVGDAPMIMYLSVTPHIQPTHTGRTPDGGRLPHRFMPSRAYDLEPDPAPVETLLDRHLTAAEAVARAAEHNAQVQQETAQRLQDALSAGDAAAAAEARRAMWEAISATFQTLEALGAAWNELAPRCDGSG